MNNQSYSRSEISNSARSDIAEVLDKYVVRPIQDGIPPKLTGINNDINKFKDSVDEKLQLLPGNISDSVKDALRSTLGDIQNDLADISNNISSVKKQTAEISQISKNTENTNSKLDGIITSDEFREKADELLGNINKRLNADKDELIKALKETAKKTKPSDGTNSQTSDIQKTINDMKEEISRQNDLIEAQSRIIETLSKTVGDLETVIKAFGIKTEENSRNIRSIYGRFRQWIK